MVVILNVAIHASAQIRTGKVDVQSKVRFRCLFHLPLRHRKAEIAGIDVQRSRFENLEFGRIGGPAAL